QSRPACRHSDLHARRLSSFYRPRCVAPVVPRKYVVQLSAERSVIGDISRTVAGPRIVRVQASSAPEEFCHAIPPTARTLALWQLEANRAEPAHAKHPHVDRARGDGFQRLRSNPTSASAASAPLAA